jgi:hypothetical protein
MYQHMIAALSPRGDQPSEQWTYLGQIEVVLVDPFRGPAGNSDWTMAFVGLDKLIYRDLQSNQSVIWAYAEFDLAVSNSGTQIDITPRTPCAALDGAQLIGDPLLGYFVQTAQAAEHHGLDAARSRVEQHRQLHAATRPN